MSGGQDDRRSFRDFRLHVAKLGLRQAAIKWGMLPSQLSAIECGRIKTDWTPPGWSECKESTQ